MEELQHGGAEMPAGGQQWRGSTSSVKSAHPLCRRQMPTSTKKKQIPNMTFVCVRQTDSTKARSDKRHGNPLGIFFKCTESKAWGYKDYQSSRKF